jgi:spore protease
MFGALTNIEKRRLINEVLTDINLDLIVTPSEIDFIIDKLSNMIACAINNSLHKDISHY